MKAKELAGTKTSELAPLRARCDSLDSSDSLDTVEGDGCANQDDKFGAFSREFEKGLVDCRVIKRGACLCFAVFSASLLISVLFGRPEMVEDLPPEMLENLSNVSNSNLLPNQDERLPTSVPTLAPTRRPFATSAPTFDPIDYNLYNETWAEAKVCVKMGLNNQHYASRFYRDFYRQFGGRVQFVLEPIMWKGVLNDQKLLDSGLNPRSEPCDPSWPILYVVSKDVATTTPEGATSKTPYLKFMAGDEKCRCDVCDGEDVTFREYYSTRMSNKKKTGPIPNKLVNMPLGPRFEFRLVSAVERAFDVTKRKYSFNFVGSSVGPHRSRLIQIVQENQRSTEFPAMGQGFFSTTRQWNPKPGYRDGSLDAVAYRRLLLNSTFTLCPKGHNYDTYRMYEAIEAGSIPIVELGSRYYRNHHNDIVPCNGSLDMYTKSKAPFIFLENWSDLPLVLERELADPVKLRQRQRDLLAWRLKFYGDIALVLECRIFQHQQKILGHSDLDISKCPPVPLD